MTSNWPAPGSTTEPPPPLDSDSVPAPAGPASAAPTGPPTGPRLDAPATPPAPPVSALRLPAWWRPNWTAAGWLAAVGSSMLLGAAVVVVASRWETITPEIRVTGLVGSLVAAFFAAERLRSTVPTTAAATAALAAALTAPTMIAAAATLQATWPTAIAVGGAAALVALEAQARRWQIATLQALMVVAAGLLAVGVSARTGVPLAPLGAAAAVVAAALGASKRSIALAAATAAVPLAVDIPEFLGGVGHGTVARLGVAGPEVAVATGVAIGVAAGVLGYVAVRRSQLWLAGAAHLTLAWAVVIWLVLAEASVTYVATAPGALLAMLAASALMHRRWPNVLGEVSTAIAPTLAGLFVMPVAIAVFVAANAPEVAPVAGLVVTAVALACTRAVFAPRVGGDTVERSAWAGAVTAGAGVAALAAVLAANASEIAPIGVVIAVLVGVWLVSCATSERLMWPLVTMVHASWTLSLAIPAEGSQGLVALIVGLAASMVVASLINERGRGAAAVIAVVTIVAVAVIDAVLWHAPSFAIGVAVVSIAVAGISVVAARLVNVAVFAGALSGAAALLAVDDGAVWVSLGVLLAAVIAVVLGSAHGADNTERFGLTAGLVALVSLWWTTGLNGATIDAIAPFGATGADLAMAAIAIGLLVVGAGARRGATVSSWLAYGPGLAIASTWSVVRQLDPTADWATVAALALGVAALAVGGWRRLGAPLVVGTVVVVASLVISAGPRLAEAPTWSWIAAGGVALLVVAGLVERVERPDRTTSAAMSLLETLRCRFD